MKKVVLLAIIFVFSFYLCSFNYKESTILNNKKIESNTNYFNLHTTFDENDYISNAIDLTDDSYFANQTFRKEMIVDLPTQVGVIDIDFYYFKVVRESEINLQLKSNTTTNIDIYLQGVNSYI